MPVVVATVVTRNASTPWDLSYPSLPLLKDARLRAKAEREAAAAERYELRTSGAARALARWLDAE